MLDMKILLILPGFHEKTISRSGDFSSREEGVHVTFPLIYERSVK